MKLILPTAVIAFCLGFIFANRYESDGELEMEYSQKSPLIVFPILDAYELLDANSGSETILKKDLICLILDNRQQLISLYEKFNKEIKDKPEPTRQMLEIHKFSIEKINDYLPSGSSPESFMNSSCPPR